MRLGGIILTGGHSRRMGRAKETLPFGAATLLAHQCTTVAGTATPVVVVSRAAAQELPPLPDGVDVAHDTEPDQGPLAGIVAGLTWLRDRHGFSAEDAAFTTANDMPFVSAEVIRWLANRIGDAPVAVPRAFGVVQPLLAVYRLAILPAAAAMLARGVRTPRTLADLPASTIVGEDELRTVDPELRCLHNVNTPADYAAARQEPERP